MIVSLIKIIFLINCLVFSFYSFGATRFVCKKGVKRVIEVNGVRKLVCVVTRKRLPPPAPASPAAPEPSPLDWNARWWAKLGARTEGEPFFASNRYRAEGEAEKGIASWTKVVLGGRLTHDLMSNIQGDEYRDDFSQNKKPEFELWNAYLDFAKGPWRARIGQQQVAWGEAFGFFYADIVNPKDFRERGLGNLSDLRLPVPMVNLQWMNQNFSVQGIWVPTFRDNRSPSTQSDFFPRTSISLPLPPGIELETNSTYKLDDDPGNYGGRISGTLSGYDLALFYYDHIDPQPYYLLDSGIPIGNKLMIRPRHNRIQSTGFTMSTEFDGVIVRSENVYTPNKYVNTFTGGALSFDETSQRVHVLGIDFPTWKKLSIGIQGSIDILESDEDILFRPKELTILSTRFSYQLPSERFLELLLSADTENFSSMIQGKFSQPLSSRHELEIGADVFSGVGESFFGQVSAGSRVYFLVKGVL